MKTNTEFDSTVKSTILEVYPHCQVESQSFENVVLRINMDCAEEAKKFVKLYSALTNTNWIISKSRSTIKRFLFSKLWVCHHNKKNKRKNSKRNASCKCSLKIVIKKVNKNTIKNDTFLKLSPPLTAVVKISLHHSHSIESAEALRMLRVSEEVKEQFFDYFSKGMTPVEAIRFHETQFLVKEDFEKIANATVNPTLCQVKYIYKSWRRLNLGSYSDHLAKLKEKPPIYESQGKTGAFREHQLFPNDHPVTTTEKHAFAVHAGPKCSSIDFSQSGEESDAENAEFEETPLDNSMFSSSASHQSTSSCIDGGDEVLATAATRRELLTAFREFYERASTLIQQSDISEKEAVRLIKLFRGVKSLDDFKRLRIQRPLSFSKRNRINVQPTSIVRQTSGVVRSARRVPAGRPAKRKK